MRDIDPELVLDALAGFARTLAHGYVVGDVLADLCTRATTVLGIEGAGVALVHGDHVSGAASSGERFADLERTQEKHQEGPSVAAVLSGHVVLAPDVSAPAELERWPHFAARAAESGVGAVAGVPMTLDGAAVGALGLYDARARRWADHELHAARILADVATGYVVNASKLDQQRRTTEQLQHALDSRVVIEQAKGIVAAHRGVTVEEAFKRLRKHANDHNATLRATAEAVVNVGLRP